MMVEVWMVGVLIPEQSLTSRATLLSLVTVTDMLAPPPVLGEGEEEVVGGGAAWVPM